MMREGLQLVIDGSDPELIKQMLEIELDFFEKQHETGAKIYETAGGFSPTMGIIGTVMGLVHVLGNLTISEALVPPLLLRLWPRCTVSLSRTSFTSLWLIN